MLICFHFIFKFGINISMQRVYKKEVIFYLPSFRTRGFIYPSLFRLRPLPVPRIVEGTLGWLCMRHSRFCNRKSFLFLRLVRKWSLCSGFVWFELVLFQIFSCWFCSEKGLFDAFLSLLSHVRNLPSVSPAMLVLVRCCFWLKFLVDSSFAIFICETKRHRLLIALLCLLYALVSTVVEGFFVSSPSVLYDSKTVPIPSLLVAVLFIANCKLCL